MLERGTMRSYDDTWSDSDWESGSHVKKKRSSTSSDESRSEQPMLPLRQMMSEDDEDDVLGEKYTRLTRKVRTCYFNHLKKILLSNYEICQENDICDWSCSEDDVIKCAASMEQKALQSSMVVLLYQRAVMRMVADIRRHTDQLKLYKKLKDYIIGDYGDISTQTNGGLECVDKTTQTEPDIPVSEIPLPSSSHETISVTPMLQNEAKPAAAQYFEPVTIKKEPPEVQGVPIPVYVSGLNSVTRSPNNLLPLVNGIEPLFSEVSQECVSNINININNLHPCPVSSDNVSDFGNRNGGRAEMSSLLRNVQEVVLQRNVQEVVPQKNVQEVVIQRNVHQVIPHKNVREVVPQNVQGVVIQKNVREVVPQKNVSEVVPHKNVREVVPQKNVQEMVIQKNVHAVIPQKNVRVMPQKNAHEVVTQKNVYEVIPQKNVHEVVPQKNVHEVVPQKNVQEAEPYEWSVIEEQTKLDAQNCVPRKTKVFVRRLSGMQEKRSSGMQERRSSGLQERRSSGLQERQLSGLQERRSSDVEERRSSSMQEKWLNDMQERWLSDKTLSNGASHVSNLSELDLEGHPRMTIDERISEVLCSNSVPLEEQPQFTEAMCEVPMMDLSEWGLEKQRQQELLQEMIQESCKDVRRRGRMRLRFLELFGSDSEDNFDSFDVDEPLSVYKDKIARWVVESLMPYYREGRILTRTVFKFLARHIADKLLAGNHLPDETTVDRSVVQFFSHHDVITSEYDIRCN